ncbi:MAG: IS3 family transposase [Pirellulales bacterium]|nr:IS3 family transposase [Pirellulales bacterium]
MIQAAEQLAESVSVSAACRALGVPRNSLYRARQTEKERQARPRPERALSQEEKVQVRRVLNSERFQDSSPRQVYATLLDEGKYLCHWRTMYRILDEHGQVRERRNQLQHPAYAKPELLATGPNQLWSWDISKLKGPVKWTHYYLYVILDLFSRYIVGWMVAEREAASLAEKLIAESCGKQGIEPSQLTLHADRGSAMRAKSVAQLLADLGITKTHSRPYTPNDNPYSESQFKTMKYRPDFPERFESVTDARSWAREFFGWYNHDHHHSGLGLMTPATVHHGRAEAVREQRQQVLLVAYAAHPERFVRGVPIPPELPNEVRINKPQTDDEEQAQPKCKRCPELVEGTRTRINV